MVMVNWSWSISWSWSWSWSCHGHGHGHERVVKLLSVTGGSDTVPLSPCLNPALSVISIKVHELLLVLQTGVGGVVC